MNALGIQGSHISYLSTDFAMDCLGKDQALINYECEEVVYCKEEQYESSNISDLNSKTSLGYVIRRSKYDTCCEAGYVHSVNGGECVKTNESSSNDWNCYEFSLYDVLICFLKGSPEGSGEPVHSTIQNYSCGDVPARPNIMYILTTSGLNECYTAPLCENANYGDSNT